MKEQIYIYQPNEFGYELVTETSKNIRISQYRAKPSHFKKATIHNLKKVQNLKKLG